jgi:hypothetical protein
VYGTYGGVPEEVHFLPKKKTPEFTTAGLLILLFLLDNFENSFTSLTLTNPGRSMGTMTKGRGG